MHSSGLLCLSTTDATVEVLATDDNQLKGIFFQDTDMMKSFESWPEFLCFDATYKLLEVRLSVFILMCEDCSGVVTI